MHIGEVSTIFEFSLSRFALSLVFALEMFVLDAEFNSLSNGSKFSKDHTHKNGDCS